MGKAKIIVIEDIEAARNSIRRMLELNDYEVALAADGKEGLKLIEQCAPDLIITDIFMPGMEGLEMIRIIAKTNPNLPIIAMTGFKGGPFLEAAQEFGAVSGLNKPFEPEVLLSVINKALKTNDNKAYDNNDA